MIQIEDKSKCCGCTACESICPHGAIEMKPDGDGFSYPVVDASKCVDCGRCEKVCPMLNLSSPNRPLTAMAAKNVSEDERMGSSSGGIFPLLAKKIIGDGGVVFGAKFDENWNVVHSWTDREDDLSAFYGSKYVQSDLRGCFSRVREFLTEGRQVLFSGVPCQIAGLRNYLGREYDNLLTVEVICHGVPSPLAWRIYMDEISDGRRVREVKFRDKRTGWNHYSMTVKTSASGDSADNCDEISMRYTDNPYILSFLHNFNLRPSCFDCPVRSGKSGGDISLGDFWGIDRVLPGFNDDKGVSLVFCNTGKGLEAVRDLPCETATVGYEDVVSTDICIEGSVPRPRNYGYFFRQLRRRRSLVGAWDDCHSNRPDKAAKRIIIRKLYKL